MTSREELIFTAALQIPPTQRRAFVDQACASEAVLCERLKALLKGLEEADGFLEEPVTPALALASTALRKSELSSREDAP